MISRVVVLVSSALLAVLAGCAAAPAKSNHHAHATMGAMDMQAHCEMHKKMMSGKSSAEQQAMMQEHMNSMSPEMRQRMQAMHEQCK
jgi:hypothetical protein